MKLKRLELLTHRFWVLAVIFSLPLLLLLFVVITWATVNNEVQSQLHAIRVAGLPTNLQELNEYAKLPPGVVDSTEEWRKATESATRLNLNTYSESLNWDWNEVFDSDSTTTAADIDQIRAMLAVMWPTLELVHSAAEMNGMIPAFAPPSSTPAPQVGIREMWAFTRLLAIDSAIAALDEESTRAFRDVRSLLEIGSGKGLQLSLSYEVVAQSIFMAKAFSLSERILENGLWIDDQLRELQERIRSVNYEERLRQCLISERSQVLTYINEHQRGLLTVWDQTVALKAFQTQLEMLDGTWGDRISNYDMAQRKMERRLTGVFRVVYSANITAEAYFSFDMFRHVANSIAKQRSIFLLIAAQRFRLKTGKLPESLEELIDAFPAAEIRDTDLWHDPYDGEPIRFLSSEEGIKIYSLGTNLIDDGGKLEGSPSDDIGFQLPR